MCNFGKGGSSRSSSTEANIARANEMTRTANVAAGTQNVNNIFDSQFTPDFFNTQRQAYVDYARPQLDEQYARTGRDLTYSLTRSGNLDSSTRGEQFGQLQRTYDTGSRAISDQANNYANQTRDAVEQARSSLISNLNSTGDAAQAVNSATNRARALSATPGFSPLGDMFSTFTNYLAQNSAAERLRSLGFPTTGVSIFGPSRNAVSVTS